MTEHARVHGSLTPEEQNDLSILEGTSIQLEVDRTETIHRAMMSGDSPEAKKLAIDALAQAVGTSAAGIAAGVGKEKTVGEGGTSGVKPVSPSAKPENINSGKGSIGTGKVVDEGTTGSLTGSLTKLPPNATPENIRSLVRENESAEILSKNGYHVEQNPVTSGIKNPDYKINGEIFDNYAPSSSNIRNIWREVDKKVQKGQTNSVVINLSDSKVTVADLQNQFSDWPVKGLDKVIVIDQSGKAARIK